MDITLVLIVSFATIFNLIILKLKFEAGRYPDLILDVGAILILNWFFAGTLYGMSIAMIASFVISLYLYLNPPRLHLKLI